MRGTFFYSDGSMEYVIQLNPSTKKIELWREYEQRKDGRIREIRYLHENGSLKFLQRWENGKLVKQQDFPLGPGRFSEIPQAVDVSYFTRAITGDLRNFWERQTINSGENI